MKPFHRGKISTGGMRIPALVVIMTLFICLPAAAESHQFEFQKVKGVRINILSHHEFNARFGGNPEIPADDEAVIRLAKRLFIPHWQVSTDRYRGEPHQWKYEVDMLFAALQNPDIYDSTRHEVDAIMEASEPPLPKTLTIGHFKFFYTDNDPNPNHNVTRNQVGQTAFFLNTSWDLSARTFKLPKHYVSGADQLIDVRIYDFPAFGRTLSSWNHILLNSKKTVRSRCMREVVSIHELFHRVQYSYGYESGTPNMMWIVEGTAFWVVKATGSRSYMPFMNQGLEKPDRNLFTERSHDATHFFVYLEKFTGWRAIRDIWAAYETNGKDARAAVETALRKWLGLNFKRFAGMWAASNYVKDLDNAGFTYDYLEDEATAVECGRRFGPLREVEDEDVIVYQATTWNKLTDVKPYGADYYTFHIQADVTSLEIRIDGQDSGDFIYFLVPIKNNRYLSMDYTTQTDHTFSRAITPRQWDRVALVVVGGSRGGSYILSVNACMTGQWIDNYGYVWRIIQNGTSIKGTVDTVSSCGTWNVTGTYSAPNLTLTAVNPLPIEGGCCTAFTYTGTVNQCNSASGNWVNACGFSGSWSMDRSSAFTILPPDNFSGPTPSSRK